MVKLHYLDLPEPPASDDEWAWVRLEWLLKNDGPPKGGGGALVETGDLIAIEKLFTGAGEFEGLRAVGPKAEDGRFVLLDVGIEYIEWPKEIVDWAKGKSSTLKELYEGVLNEVLDKNGGFSMEDLVDDLDEFWSNPETTGAHKPQSEEWSILLSQCTRKPEPPTES